MAGELILIIEDNDKNLKLVRDVLQFNDYETAEAMTAEDGLVLARSQHPALILLDIQLPGMDGFAALRQLRACGRGRGRGILDVRPDRRHLGVLFERLGADERLVEHAGQRVDVGGRADALLPTQTVINVRKAVAPVRFFHTGQVSPECANRSAIRHAPGWRLLRFDNGRADRAL